MKQKIVIIMGPTAVGKTDLALSVASHFNGAIISADSMQVYKYLNIGTAKESREELNFVPHYLIDFLEPTQTFNAGNFKEQAEQILDKLKSQNKLAIIAGGTGLYVKSLITTFNFSNAKPNLEIRQKYENLAKEFGNEYVYNILKEIDEESANALHYNELKKVIRAMEIFETTGKKKSQQKNSNKLNPKYEPLILILNRDRKLLYDRINYRVDKMFEMGLVEEAKYLYENNLFNNLSREAIGYKQLIEYFENKISLEEAKEKIKQLSRNYAKRQITFFKSFENAIWLDAESDKQKVFDIIEEFLKKECN